MGLPESGTVLGIDVGYSKRRRTTAFCRLDWDGSDVRVQQSLATSDAMERRGNLRALLHGRPLLSGVAIDGPLAHGLRHVTRYRTAEALLSQGLMQKRGKPGQTSSPVGQQLHAHATQLALLAIELAPIVPATHFRPVTPLRVVEAFPNAFLACLIPEKRIPALARDASDRYWEIVAGPDGMLATALSHLLPDREQALDFEAISHHDHRAGVVCALTALTVAAGLHVAVGDDVDGDIMLPAREWWGAADNGVPWMQRELTSALHSLRVSSKGDTLPRVADVSGPWTE